MRGDSNLSDSDFFRSQDMYRKKIEKYYSEKEFTYKPQEDKKSKTLFQKLLSIFRGK